MWHQNENMYLFDEDKKAEIKEVKYTEEYEEDTHDAALRSSRGRCVVVDLNGFSQRARAEVQPVLVAGPDRSIAAAAACRRVEPAGRIV